MNKQDLYYLILILFIGSIIISCKNTSTSEKTDTKSDQITIIDSNQSWAARMGETVLNLYPDIREIEGQSSPQWNYTCGLVSLSMIRLYQSTGDERYYNYAKKYIDELVEEDGTIKTYKMEKYNIDKINSGKVLFPIYEKTGDEKYKKAMDTLRTQLKNHPRTKAGGFWHKKRYPWQMWLDGLYMGAPFYAQYGVTFNEPESVDDAVNWIIVMEKKARDSKTGLLYHAWDESREQKWADKETGLAPNFWGRGMGWYGMALVDILDYVPADHPRRTEIVVIIQRMAEAIMKVQDKETGVWYQVLDQAGRKGNYLEGSVSSMFSYFLLKAVAKGYIDKTTYLPLANKAFEGTTKNLMKIDSTGNLILTPVCAVAGLGGNPYRDGSYEYYINERRRDNDPKAVGPFIMAAILYDELNK